MRGAADSGRNPNGVNRAIQGAGPAFHAPVPIRNAGFLPGHIEHGVRTNIDAHAAPDACIRIQNQGRNVFQVSQFLHDAFSPFQMNGDAIHKIKPRTAAATWNGKVMRISFSTPDGEVYGVAPVKFMAKYELIAVRTSTIPALSIIPV